MIRYLLFVFSLYFIQVFAQNISLEGQVWGAYIDPDQYRLEMEFKNDTLCELSYRKGYNGNKFMVNYENYADSVVFKHPWTGPDSSFLTHIETYFDKNEKLDSGTILIENYSYDPIYGMTMQLINDYSLDGIREDTLWSGTPLNLKGADSIRINGIWEYIPDSLKEAGMVIQQYYNSFTPPSKFVYEYLPRYFDRLVLLKEGDVWSLKPNSLLPEFNDELFLEVRCKTWSYDYENKLRVSLSEDHAFFEPEWITVLSGTSEEFEQIDLSNYPNVERIEVEILKPIFTLNTNRAIDVHLTTKSKGDNLRLKGQHDSLDWLFAPFPIKTRAKYINYYSATISNSNQWKKLESEIGLARGLGLKLSEGSEPLFFSEKYAHLEYISLIKDTISLDCNSFAFSHMDSLVLYGHAKSYDFLECDFSVDFLGVYYSNEGDLPMLKRKHSDVEYQSYCFPDQSGVNLTKNRFKPIADLRVGDLVLAYTPDSGFFQTPVTAVEYHFGVCDTLVNYHSPDLLVSAGGERVHYYNASSTEGHPLFWVGNDLIMTVEGGENQSGMYLTTFHYEGTLVNIRTEAGNFFVGNVGFLNK